MFGLSVMRAVSDDTVDAIADVAASARVMVTVRTRSREDEREDEAEGRFSLKETEEVVAMVAQAQVSHCRDTRYRI